MKIRFLILTLIPVSCLLSPISSSAVDLTFDAAVEKIMAENNDVRKASDNATRAQASLDAANSNRWFNLSGNATYMNMVNVARPFSGTGFDLPPELGGILAGIPGFQNQQIAIPDNILMAGVTLTQPIYTFGKIGYAVDAARSGLKISESQNELVKRSARYAAAELYWNAKMTDGLVKIAEKNLAAARDAKRNLDSAGRASSPNLIKISADIATKEVSLSDAKFNRDSAYRILKIMAGMDVDAELNLTTEIPDTFGAIATKKMESNPQFDIYENQARALEASARARRAARYPTLAATASYNFIDMHDDYRLWNGSKTQSAYWGLALQVPIWDGGLSRANATMDAMDAAAAREDLSKAKKLLTNQYNTAVLKYKHWVGNLSNLKNAAALAQKSADISANRFANGQASAVELSDVQNALSQVNMGVLNARVQILLAAEEIKKLNGE